MSTPSPIIYKVPVLTPEMARPDAMQDPNSPAVLMNKIVQLQADAVSSNKYTPPVPLSEGFRASVRDVQYAATLFIFGTALLFFSQAI
jgi:hypothetical protein